MRALRAIMTAAGAVTVLAMLNSWPMLIFGAVPNHKTEMQTPDQAVPVPAKAATPQGTREVTLTFQTFEGDVPVAGPEGCAPPCWSSYSIPLGNPFWGITSCDAYRGVHSVWCAVTNGVQPCPGENPYFNNMNAVIGCGSYDMSDAVAIGLYFRAKQDIEIGYDRLWLDVWGNGVHDSVPIPVTGPDWQYYPWDLSSYAGQAGFALAFRFVSDGSITYGGVFLDDVKLVKWAYCNCYCQHDPDCNGSTDIVDVTQTINVAFRGQAPELDPNTTCPFQKTDLDCSDQTDIIDVSKMINVAFRGANAVTEFCDRCP